MQQSSEDALQYEEDVILIFSSGFICPLNERLRKKNHITVQYSQFNFSTTVFGTISIAGMNRRRWKNVSSGFSLNRSRALRELAQARKRYYYSRDPYRKQLAPLIIVELLISISAPWYR